MVIGFAPERVCKPSVFPVTERLSRDAERARMPVIHPDVPGGGKTCDDRSSDGIVPPHEGIMNHPQ
jgi:hypothetical protein